MRTLRPWIAGYLVLCFAFAGAVGLSPFLHQLIEHGGRGEWHTHTHEVDPKRLIFEGAATGEYVEPAVRVEIKPKPVFTRNHRPFKLPTAQVAKLIGVLVDRLGSLEKGSGDSGEGHEHHSLAQLLASGLLDQHIEISVSPHFAPSCSYRLLSANELLLASIWNAQTPDRGPPVFVS